jgi:hypothetical protein
MPSSRTSSARVLLAETQRSSPFMLTRKTVPYFIAGMQFLPAESLRDGE